MSNLKGEMAAGPLGLQAPWDTLRILLGVLFFLFVGVSLTSLYPLLRLGGTAVLGLIAVMLLLNSPGYGFRPRALHAAFVGLLLYEAISLLWTPYPSAGAEHLIYHFFLYIFFICIQLLLLGKWETKNVRDALMLLGITFVILDLLIFFKWYRSWLSISSSPLPPIGYRSSGHLLGHPNSLGGFLSLLLPIAFARAFVSEKRTERLSYMLVFLILGFGLFLTSSRGAWLAGLAGLGATTILLTST
ncbi:MAG: hypothetical protein ACLFWD_06870, partial [Anaerolineales bacterium]